MSKRDPSKPKVEIRDSSSGIRPSWRRFPGPAGAEAPMRVAVDRGAFAEITAHAKDFLDVEVCGVLVGTVCEDDEGVWVHVEAVVRGTAARQANTHVTFTQETWNAIHEALERDHRHRRIVGWYHTHPGFGVEFSEMDLFIQRNFFPDPAQIALVTDPLGGAIAICMNGASGIEYLDRFWVDGREQPCRRPAAAGTQPGAARTEPAAPGGVSTEAFQALEGRVSQLLHAIEETRTLYFRVLASCAMVFCLVVIGTAGYLVWQSFRSRVEPPKMNSMVPIPVKLGDRTILVGVGVVEWQVPDDLNAIYLETARELADRMSESMAMPLPGPALPAPADPSRPAPNPSPTHPAP